MNNFYESYNTIEKELISIANFLNCNKKDILKNVNKILEENKKLKEQISNLKTTKDT